MKKNPFLRLGNIKKEEIHTIYERSFTDILKIWLYVSGPINILKYIYEKKGITENIPVGHMCQLCQKIFCNKEYLTVLREHIGDFGPSVLLKYNLLTKKKN